MFQIGQKIHQAIGNIETVAEFRSGTWCVNFIFVIKSVERVL